jgi:hypothetical protein
LEVVKAADNLITWGKTVDEWHKELTVHIDHSADPAKIKMYCSQLSYNLNQAYRYLSKSKSVAFSQGLAYNKAFNEKIAAQALNRSRKVAPAMDTMTRVAESQLPEMVLVQKRADMQVEFWEQMVWKVKDQINIVNTMSMSNGTLYKVGEYNA